MELYPRWQAARLTDDSQQSSLPAEIDLGVRAGFPQYPIILGGIGKLCRYVLQNLKLLKQSLPRIVRGMNGQKRPLTLLVLVTNHETRRLIGPQLIAQHDTPQRIAISGEDETSTSAHNPRQFRNPVLSNRLG